MSGKAGLRSFLERFKDALTVAAVDTKSPTAVGRFLGVNKQTADRWLQGGEPTPAMLYLIADKAKVSARWLALEDVPMAPQLDLSEEEREAIEEIYRVLLKRSPKTLRKWLRDGHELVELTTSGAPVFPPTKETSR